MRADRLIAVLMLLQRHGTVTAARVAEELEISTRTARRDLEALSTAGVPVYPSRGRGGGWQLVGGARTDLTGLTGPEVRALFLAAGSVPGQSEETRRALAKLQHAVPTTFRAEAAAAASAIFVDSGDPAGQGPAALDALQEAIARGRRVELDYRDRTGAESLRVVDPLGLVTRSRVWYLVADTDAGRRTFRVDRVREARAQADAVRRPEGFDLATAWSEINAALERERPVARLSARVRPWVLRVLLRLPGISVDAVGPADDGWHPVELAGTSLFSLSGQIAGFAPGLEVIEPAEARRILAEIGVSLLSRYG